MADATIEINPGSGGPLLDTETVDGRHRERIQVSGALLTAIARVHNATLSPTDYALATRDAGAVSARVAAGQFNLASSGRVTLAAAGNLRAVMQNPAGSGKTLSVVRLAAFTTATGYGSLYVNPTVGVPVTAARPAMNAVIGGGVPAVATLRVDTNLTVALGGGTDTGIVVGLPAGARTSLDFPPLIITPGVTLGINVPFTGAADATLSVYWFES